MSTVRVVLDASALLAYARLRGLATAELVTMVEEDGGASLVGIPAACFLTAYEQLEPDEQQRLVRLATTSEGVTVILPLTGTDTVEVAALGSVMGHAVVETRRWRAIMATYDGATARKHLPQRRVLELDDA